MIISDLAENLKININVKNIFNFWVKPLGSTLKGSNNLKKLKISEKCIVLKFN